MTNLHVVFCNAMGHGGVAYTITELLDNMPASPLSPRLWFPQGDSTLTRQYHRPVLSRLVWRMLCNLRIPMSWQGHVVMRGALREIRAGDIVYVWPPFDLAFITAAKMRGATVVAERIGCMGATCKATLERAYARIGRCLPEGWYTQEAIVEESAQMQLCDYVCAPNDYVMRGLLDVGIPHERILETSYGWSPERLAEAVSIERPDRRPVFAFVGQGSIGKGLNLLLEAWEEADVRGTLLLAGEIQNDVRQLCARGLARPDVREVGYIRNIATVYAASDVFVLPTHHEGGPQVTYEAAGCGLPAIVSPMGAGRIIRDGKEGYVIDPFNSDSWVKAIRDLAGEAELRRSFAEAARHRAKEFTWERVSGRLFELFENVLAESRMREGITAKALAD